jgi:DNA helicase-2/ATP-dependent DNA helicase PcrA
VPWDEGLLDDQRRAASHIGCHARLLAGPGTGKTLTLSRRAAYLVAEQRISPNQILALTFTRAAAFELRKRIENILGNQQSEFPRVSTLHSFALRQLLRNSDRIETFPRPLRVADNWEERNIIFEDLKDILSVNLATIKKRFELLSADWQTLEADAENWQANFIDPHFLGAWRQHRMIYSYTMRSELVYQLKSALEQTEEFSLESNFSHLLIDEYQDLNLCDLAIISALREKGMEIFGAGDDDQSIYGFRFAYPQGIRRFDIENIPSESLVLSTCVRCDRAIINLSQFVANLDPDRLEKPLEPRSDAGNGEVHILRFRNQITEASGVSKICRFLLNRESYVPNDILILMRSDTRKIFSSELRNALETQGIPVSVRVEDTPLDLPEGRIFLDFLHLLAEENDSLALRTLLMLRDNRIGTECCSSIYRLSLRRSEAFYLATRSLIREPELIPRLGERIKDELQEIQRILERHRIAFGNLDNSHEQHNLLEALRNLAEQVIENVNKRVEVLSFLESIIEEENLTNHKDLLRALSSSIEDEEQELDSDRVNIMTMHKAKGLTAKAVIIIAGEDEYIPGRQIGEQEGDARRLLYVSLSRARHFLAVTYCERRTQQQTYTGRTSGNPYRTLTRFLRDAPVRPINGERFADQL